jgi:translocation and assembly module TamA
VVIGSESQLKSQARASSAGLGICKSSLLAFSHESCKECASRFLWCGGAALSSFWSDGLLARKLALGCLAVLSLTGSAFALDRFDFSTPGANEDLRTSLLGASLLAQAERDGTNDAQSLFSAARADYGRLIGALYAEGYYSGVINILVDGKEAAGIAPLDAPNSIRVVQVKVEPGPQFTFSRARMKPYARGTNLPAAYADTKPARSSAIVDAAAAGIEGWRNVGYAKAKVASQKIVADHRTATLDSEILLNAGQRVRFGQLSISGYKRMNPQRLAKIAGFPTGEIFDPKQLSVVATRLRRTGVFKSVALTEAEKLGPGDTLDVNLVVAEEKLRRFGFGAEVSSSEGLNLSGYWLHRNLLGGGERLRIDAAIDRIGSNSSNLGYNVGARIERPATPVTDASAFVEARASRKDVVDLTVDSVSIGLGLSRVLNDHLNAEAGLFYIDSTATDLAGSLHYRQIALPISLTWDNRDKALDARKGYYLGAGVTPFLGLGSTGSGAQIKADARAYRSFGADERFVVAGRLQLGTVVGPSLVETPPDYLFYSGGGGTVRGQPYQSLGVPVVRSPTITVQSGGMSFIGVSGEFRAGVTKTIGVVAFYDAGYVGAGSRFGRAGQWQSGAGLGLRYDTGIGPIRFDVGVPVAGSTGKGAQFYVGIGQSF